MDEQNEWDYASDTVTLCNEDGEEQEFEILDAVETDDARYVALRAVYDDPAKMLESDGELLIMRVETEDDGEVLVTIEDEDEFNDMLDVFVNRLSDYYDIDCDENE